MRPKSINKARAEVLTLVSTLYNLNTTGLWLWLLD